MLNTTRQVMIFIQWYIIVVIDIPAIFSNIIELAIRTDNIIKAMFSSAFIAILLFNYPYMTKYPISDYKHKYDCHYVVISNK